LRGPRNGAQAGSWVHLCIGCSRPVTPWSGWTTSLTGTPANLAHLDSNTRFKLLRHDVSMFIDVQGPLEGVLHFASPASPIDYLEHPIPTLKVGALGTHNSLGTRESEGRPLPARVDVRGLR